MAAHTRKTKNGQPDGSIASVRLLFAVCFSLRAATGSVSSGERIEAFSIPGAVPAFTRRFSAPTIRRGAHSSFLPIRFGCVRRCAAERYVHKRMTWERLTHPALTQFRRAAPVIWQSGGARFASRLSARRRSPSSCRAARPCFTARRGSYTSCAACQVCGSSVCRPPASCFPILRAMSAGALRVTAPAGARCSPQDRRTGSRRWGSVPPAFPAGPAWRPS